MGQIQNACGQNLFNQFLNRYGDNAIKLIAAQKSKIIIDDKFNEITRKFYQSFQQHQTCLLKLIQDKINDIKNAFQGLKSKANNILPGGISTLQRIKGKSINQFTGFNQLIKQVDDIQYQSLSNLQVKKKQMIFKLEDKKSQMLHQIDTQKPQIPYLDQIPQPLKVQIFKQAQKNFSDQLTKNQSQLNQNVSKLFNASALDRMFQQMSPIKIIQNLFAKNFGQLEKNIFSGIGGNSFGIGNLF